MPIVIVIRFESMDDILPSFIGTCGRAGETPTPTAAGDGGATLLLRQSRLEHTKHSEPTIHRS